MTLRKKLILYVLPILLVAIGTIAFWGTKSLSVALLESTRAEAIKQTESMAWMMKKQIGYSEVSGQELIIIKEIMNDLIRDDEQLLLINESGLTEFKTSSSGLKYFDNDLFDPTEKTISRYTRMNDKIILTVSTKFDVIDRVWTLSRSTDVSHLDLVYREYTLNTLVFYTAVVVLALVSIIGSARQITNPINELIETMREIQKNSLSDRVQLKKIRELQILGQTFNELMDNVEERHQKVIQERDVRQNFIDSLRHEMRTPLTSIIGYSDLMRKGILDSKEQVESSETVYLEASRLQAMSDALLYGLMAKGELQYSCIETIKLVNDLVKTYKLQLDEKKLNIVSKVELEYINAEPILIFQAIGNLIDNAIKASPFNGEILLEVNSRGISVCDHGSGAYSKPVKETIRSEGYGLGLHIVREIVMAHGWAFKLETRVSKGTTSKIEF